MKAQECGGSLRVETNQNGTGMSFVFTVYAGLEGLELLEEEKEKISGRERSLSRDLSSYLHFEVENEKEKAIVSFEVTAYLMRIDLDCGERIQFFVSADLHKHHTKSLSLSLSEERDISDNLSEELKDLKGDSAYEKIVFTISSKAHFELVKLREEVEKEQEELREMLASFGEDRYN